MREADLDAGQQEVVNHRIYRDTSGIGVKGENAKQRDNQNCSVRAWVNPDTTFKAELRFDNLNGAELGAAALALLARRGATSQSRRRQTAGLRVGHDENCQRRDTGSPRKTQGVWHADSDLRRRAGVGAQQHGGGSGQSDRD